MNSFNGYGRQLNNFADTLCFGAKCHLASISAIDVNDVLVDIADHLDRRGEELDPKNFSLQELL